MKTLRQYLDLTGTTQEKFARRLGVTQGTVAGWLNGRYLPSPARLKSISRVTRIPIERLLSDVRAA